MEKKSLTDKIFIHKEWIGGNSILVEDVKEAVKEFQNDVQHEDNSSDGRVSILYVLKRLRKRFGELVK